MLDHYLSEFRGDLNQFCGSKLIAWRHESIHRYHNVANSLLLL